MQFSSDTRQVKAKSIYSPSNAMMHCLPVALQCLMFQSYVQYKNKQMTYLLPVGFSQKEEGTRLIEKDFHKMYQPNLQEINPPVKQLRCFTSSLLELYTSVLVGQNDTYFNHTPVRKLACVRSCRFLFFNFFFFFLASNKLKLEL